VIHLLHGSLVDRHFGMRLGPEAPEPLGPDALAALFERVRRCARCRRRYERQLLFERVRPDGDALREERSWAAITSAAGVEPAVGAAGVEPAARAAGWPAGSEPARASSRRRTFAILGASLAAAVVLLLPLLPKTPTEREPVARGGTGEAPLPALHLYRTREGASGPVEGQLRAGDGVLVAYSNPSDLGFLMVFAVDQRGGVHWYYPGYERLGEDPAAVPIRTRAFGVELGEEIRHDLPRGALRMFGLFLPRPLHVLEVEALVGRALAQSGAEVRALDHLELAEGEQTSLLLEVGP
jgi:hypothetical protein